MKTYLVTGSSGLVGSALVKKLRADGVNVIATRRDISDAYECVGVIDCIIHCAAMTSSKAFVEQPVETIDSIVWLTRKVLDFAREKKVKSMVYLSTMEVYGLTDSMDVKENDYASLDSMSVRNSYPEAKRLAENLCVAYANEYGVPVRIARLTQTFGAGVRHGDRRVFAQFAEAAMEGRDIVLKSEGRTARCYCGIDDAVSGILTIAEKGETGVAYNVANPETFCTIREMADMVAEEFSNGRSNVVVDLSGAEKCGYLPTFRMKLNVERLKALGWMPRQGLHEMFRALIDNMG